MGFRRYGDHKHTTLATPEVVHRASAAGGGNWHCVGVLLAVPGRDASEFDWLVFEQAGVLTSRQAISALGRAAVRTNLSQGRWRAVCRGVILTENGHLWPEQQLWVAVLAAGDGARLAGAAAAAAGGVRGMRTEVIDVLVPAARSPTGRLSRLPDDMCPVRVRRTTVLPDEHLQHGLPPRTTVARAVIDAAAWSGSDRAAAGVILGACQQKRVTPEELWQAIAVLPRIRRHKLINATIADACGGAEALSEIDLIALCRRSGLPLPRLQAHRLDVHGRRRFLDAYWADERLHVEVDGAHHMEVEHWADDMLRQNAVWTRGDRILRFPAWLLRTDPATVVAQLREALAIPPRP
ncbi:hypothetical protein Ait01nite_063960 [Actinoplanes italicus]|nr:hypothetical protein Ait01nite_063960 [Actinoplanes italicus]